MSNIFDVLKSVEAGLLAAEARAEELEEELQRACNQRNIAEAVADCCLEGHYSTPYTRIEIHSGPDSRGRYLHTRFWMADYHPGHPDGEHRRAERGQVFNAPLPGGGVPVRQEIGGEGE